MRLLLIKVVVAAQENEDFSVLVDVDCLDGGVRRFH